MSSHTCVFSVMRFQARYRGNLYDLDECESCGTLRLATGPEEERCIIPPGSTEFDDVLAFLEFMIKRAARKIPPASGLRVTPTIEAGYAESCLVVEELLAA
jgi:hypothetical protein